MKARLPQGMGGGPSNMQGMMKQVQKMQEQMTELQEDLECRRRCRIGEDQRQKGDTLDLHQARDS